MAGNPAFGNRIRELREAKRQSDPTFSLRQFAQRLWSASGLPELSIAGAGRRKPKLSRATGIPFALPREVCLTMLAGSIDSYSVIVTLVVNRL